MFRSTSKDDAIKMIKKRKRLLIDGKYKSFQSLKAGSSSQKGSESVSANSPNQQSMQDDSVDDINN